MGAFESSQLFPVTVADLEPVARDVMQYFESQDYEVSGEQTNTRGWLISIYKGGFFKQIMGLQTALNIQIEPTSAGTLAKAGIGIFGQQAIPTMITMLVAWPVVLPQIWGMVRQGNMDEEALAAVQQSLASYSGTTAAANAATTAEAKFCSNCGAALPPAARFCMECGTEVVST